MRRLWVLAALLVAAPTLAETPRIAIIIDDLGYVRDEGLRAARLPVPLTVAILPSGPRAAALAAEALCTGKEVLLHLPLQALGLQSSVEPDRITASMSDAEIAEIFDRAMAAVPGAVGVNNHRGSLVTQQYEPMRRLMSEIRRRPSLFFIDSYTTAGSVALDAALDAGIPAARRDVFLDASRNPDDIRAQLERVKRKARTNGVAVAIGHPYPETIALLEEALPRLLDEGFELVPVSDVLVQPSMKAEARTIDQPVVGASGGN